jgi:signal transduction histidine kinase
MKRMPSWQLTAMIVLLALYALASAIERPGFVLTAMSDITGTVLWVIAIGTMLSAALSHKGRTRWFWILLAVSAAMVGSNLAAWLYYEVFVGHQPPDQFWADIPLFLQPVPMMAAAAMRPGSRQRDEKFHLTTLNFLILLLWWVCLYMFLVYPNEYILPNKIAFNSYYYALFLLEFSVLLAVIGGMALVAEGAWRKIYWHLFFASALYLLAYQWLNAALERGEYFSGSYYDIPNYASIGWFILIAVRGRGMTAEPSEASERDPRVDASGILAVSAVLSLPALGLYGLFLDPNGSQLRPFRLSVVLVGILFVGICVFLRQMLLAREMARLLLNSKENLEHLKRAQSQLMQRERLAGIGQLVSGVAHELNNPLTAVIGYADLLSDEVSNDSSQQKLQRLGTEARRIKRIIDNLLSFARPRQEGRQPTDIAVVVNESLALCSHLLKSRGITVEMIFSPALPRLALNEGQFKQVFVNLFSNATNALEQAEKKKILVEGYQEGAKVVIRFSDSGPGFTDIHRAFDPFYTTRPVGHGTGLGLSICYGTVKDHNSNIYVKNLEPHGAAVVIELPVETTEVRSVASARVV